MIPSWDLEWGELFELVLNGFLSLLKMAEMGEDRIIRGDMAICKPEWREARKERNWAVQVVQIVGAEDSLLVVERDMTLKVR